MATEADPRTGGDDTESQDATTQAAPGAGMSLRKRLYRGTNDINFVRLFRYAGVISGLAVVVAVVFLFTQGLKLSIEFEGGSVWEIPSQDFTEDQALAVLSEAGIEGGQVQESETVDGQRIVRVTAQAESVAQGAELAGTYTDAAGLDSGSVTVTTVGPSWGDDITTQARTSLIVFLALVAIYITWTLEARMAVAALIGVTHDILITVGVYALFQITVTPATVISFLTIIGFSLYDTIVVYDRVQENGERILRSGRYTYTAIMRRSLNQSVTRTINTTTVAVLPVVSMLVVGKGLLGQQTLADFSLALLIGLMLGTYSSMFVAAPLTVLLKERETQWSDVRSKLQSKGLDTADTAWYGIGTDAAARPATVATRTAGGGSGATKPAAVSAATAIETHRGHPPRPRKKRKR